MKYISTRGGGESLSFSEVVLEGLARDGGLYLPESAPDLSGRLEELSQLRYQDLALEIFMPYMAPEFAAAEIAQLIEASYARFDHPSITPLKKAGDHWVLELFHGPTLAFKDLALQFLGNLFEALLKKSGGKLNIVGATSGDTGSAAIHGVRGKSGINIFILHPKGKVSPIQALQMTSVTDPNVFNIALEGTFDDCQNRVKDLFGDLAFKDQYQLAAVNSINWARVMAQIVYYFFAYFRWREKTGLPKVVFSVPTGNFGDIYAGFMAKAMGLPIQKLILATNENDILTRAFQAGDYSTKAVKPTISPSMDIQRASNFERFLYDLSGKNPSQVSAWMDQLKKLGAIHLSPELLTLANQEIEAHRADQVECLEVMGRYFKSGIALDPHTAVGLVAAEKSGYNEVICLATAHPAKFAEAYKLATGEEPKRPKSLEGIEERETRCLEVANDEKAIRNLIEERV